MHVVVSKGLVYKWPCTSVRREEARSSCTKSHNGFCCNPGIVHKRSISESFFIRVGCCPPRWNFGTLSEGIFLCRSTSHQPRRVHSRFDQPSLDCELKQSETTRQSQDGAGHAIRTTRTNASGLWQIGTRISIIQKKVLDKTFLRDSSCPRAGCL